MKTPLSYYGGKQQLASKIVSLIPEHKIYCEPFIGGAAVFFRKAPSEVEIINFYEVLQRDFSALQYEISISLHSRKLHQHARVVYENPDMFDRIKRTWAVWMLGNCSFDNNFIAGFGYDRTGAETRKLAHKRSTFTEEIAIRLQNGWLVQTVEDTKKVYLSQESIVGETLRHPVAFAQNHLWHIP